MYGLETILSYKQDFWKYLTFLSSLNSFFSSPEMMYKSFYVRSEFITKLSLNMNDNVSLSLKYRWFYVYMPDLADRYSLAQILISADLNGGFRMF